MFRKIAKKWTLFGAVRMYDETKIYQEVINCDLCNLMALLKNGKEVFQSFNTADVLTATL